MEFGERKRIKRLILPGLLLVGILWLPFSAFLAYVALDNGELDIWLISIALIAVLGFAVLRHLHELYVYPLVEIHGEHVIITAPFRKRSVYEISNIGRVVMLGPSLFFTHMGWPTFASLRGLTPAQLSELKQVLSGG